MPRLVTISFTGFDASGGVPKFNRDLRSAVDDWDHVHYCWTDLWASVTPSSIDIPEWEKARILNHWLVSTRKLSRDDVIVADGFWADGLEHLPRVVSVAHGIWSHLTKEDVDAGKEPEFPLHHAAQVSFRTKWMRLKRPMVAVSEFISEQLKLQWGWDVPFINNGVDTDFYRPSWYDTTGGDRTLGKSDFPVCCTRPLILHGVNDRGNENKGWSHIELLKREFPEPYQVMSLDEAYSAWHIRSDHPWEKHEVLAQADLFVHPSGYEGNSMMVAEVLSSGLPIVCYDVGFMCYPGCGPEAVGRIIPRSERSPERTLQAVHDVLSEKGFARQNMGLRARGLAEQYLDISVFRQRWRYRLERML